MQFQHLLTASRFLTPARPFVLPEDEQAFRSAYRKGGYGFAVAVMFVGTIMAFAFIAISSLQPIDGSNSPELQLLRAVIGTACLSSFLTLVLTPKWALDHHFLTVFLPSFVALAGLGLLLFMPRHEVVSPLAFGRSTLSLIIAIWLISAFCRLPLKQIMAMSLGASLFNLIGLQNLDVTHLPFFALDLLIANFTVWTLTIQIEKRERLLWYQSNKAQRALVRAERDANRATVLNQVQTRLMQSVGHDIRQPLSSGGIYLGLVGNEAAQIANHDIAAHAESLGGCLRAVESTLNRLLESNNQCAIESDLPTEKSSLVGVFKDLNHVFVPQAERLGVELRFTRTSRQAHPVRTNEAAILEVLSNLISNALKYSSIRGDARSGAVIVGIASLGDTVRIDVVDNGVGIDPGIHSRVFEEYFRAPETTERVAGAGLGLTIVESMIQRLPEHRLRLSSAPGMGTKIQIYLPAA
ncbi:MAG: sensor histidine kinase [Burkholderiaceae bacterium]